MAHAPTRAWRRTRGMVPVSLLALAACSDQLPTERSLEATTPSLDVQAASIPGFSGNIRIGLVSWASSVRIGSTTDYVLRDRVADQVILSGSSADVLTVTLVSRTVQTFYRMQIVCTRSETERDDWVAAASAKGYATFTEYAAHASCWRLRIGHLTSSEYNNTTFRSAFEAQTIADGVNPWGGKSWTSYSTVTAVYRIARGAETYTASSVVLEPQNDGLMRMEVTERGRKVWRKFRGKAEVTVNSGGALAGVNELPLEQYLYGVVPRELPPVPYGELEAQKAQAVAARTYAIANLGKRRANGYDLLPTDSDQVYSGYEVEHPISNAAVEGTAGVVATVSGRLITTFYHSTSGGYTANSEDVYRDPYSYLRGVPDAERGQAFEHVPTLEVFKRHANPTNLRNHAEGDFESDWSRYHRWTVEWTRDEMAEALRAGFRRADITEVSEVNVLDRADQGRVRLIQFKTNVGDLTAVKDGIRWRLRYIAVSSTGVRTLSSLRSTLFYIEPQLDPATGQVTGWKAYGGGWGHGVGMSQTGAVGMAKRGRSFDEILRHYYRGVSLERWSY